MCANISFLVIYVVSTLGSTDTVAYSTVGINDPITSALNIILGKLIFIYNAQD